MARTLAAVLMAASLVGLMLLISAPAQSPPAETAAPNEDPRVDALTKQTEELKREVADQARRIANLEAAVKALQTPPPPAPIPAPSPLWHSATNWNSIKPGMSEADVVQLLGPPSSVQSVEDTRKLFYNPDPHSTFTLSGTVTLMDDRVIAMMPPAF